MMMSSSLRPNQSNRETLAVTPEAARQFEDYADEYANLTEASIQASGESHSYFHTYKVDCLSRLGLNSALPLLDYGCGIGSLTEHLTQRFEKVEGYDPSQKSLRVARRRLPGLVFHQNPDQLPDARFGCAVLSGVLHHVHPEYREGMLARLRRTLAPGAKLVVFEHNPWNPLTRRAVKSCPYDDDAILLWPGELRRVIRAAGYKHVRLDYIVFFPRWLAPFRALEPRLRWLVFGAQTMVVGTNP
jgi:SAM-dependent methyltransferase